MNSDSWHKAKGSDPVQISDGIVPKTQETGEDFPVFERSGLGALSDLESVEWKRLFSQLEEHQSLFLNNEPFFRSQELSCSKDPLHQWSRVWEYPYVYHHISKFRQEFPSKNRLPRIIDFGSGVSFFPFSIAKLGFQVMCVDIDPVCERDMIRANKVTTCLPGKVEFLLSDGLKIPMNDQSVDGIYCVSVLEHIKQFEKTIEEIARVLVPRGRLIITFDLAASGEAEINIGRYKYLRSLLDTYFDLHEKEITVHPNVGSFPLEAFSGIRLIYFKLKQGLKPLFGMKRAPILKLYVYGGVFSRKGLS